MVSKRFCDRCNKEISDRDGYIELRQILGMYVSPVITPMLKDIENEFCSAECIVKALTTYRSDK